MKELKVPEDEVILRLSRDPEDFKALLERNFTVNRERYNPPHWVINIKVHLLPLTSTQRMKAFDSIEEIWQRFIRGWIEDFKLETGYDIYTEGRSGGYMFVDGISETFEVEEEEEEDEDGKLMKVKKIYDSEYREIDIENLRERAEAMIKFRREWDNLLNDIKAWLNRKREAKPKS